MKWAGSLVGKTRRLQRRQCGFKSRPVHHKIDTIKMKKWCGVILLLISCLLVFWWMCGQLCIVKNTCETKLLYAACLFFFGWLVLWSENKIKTERKK